MFSFSFHPSSLDLSAGWKWVQFQAQVCIRSYTGNMTSSSVKPALTGPKDKVMELVPRHITVFSAILKTEIALGRGCSGRTCLCVIKKKVSKWFKTKLITVSNIQFVYIFGCVSFLYEIDLREYRLTSYAFYSCSFLPKLPNRQQKIISLGMF